MALAHPAAPFEQRTMAPLPHSPALMPELAGLTAGVTLAVLDALLVQTTASSFALLLVSSSVILFSTVLLVLALRAGLLIADLIGGGSWRRATVGALLTLPIGIAVSTRLFGGTWISTQSWAPAGPYLLTPLLTALAAVGLRLVGALASRLARSRWRSLLALPAVGLAAALGWADAALYPNQYDFLHWLLLLCVALSLMSATWLLLSRGGSQTWHWAAPALLFSAILPFATASQVSLPSNRLKQALIEHTYSAGRLVQVYRGLLDADGDGHSIAFGESDCDNDDPLVHPLAPDIPGNGIDEDCDGFDAVRPAPPPRTPDRLDVSGYRAGLARWRRQRRFRRALQRTSSYNVVLLVIDALRADQLEPTQDNEQNHPALMKLARQGRTFTRAFSAGSGTDIGMATVFTGQLDPFKPEHINLLDAYQRAGVYTHGVYQREVARWLGRQLDVKGLRSSKIVVNDPNKRDVGSRATAKLVTDEGIRFIREQGGERFLLWLHYFDVHEHHQIDPETLGDARAFAAPQGMPFYRSLLRYTAGHIGHLLDALEQQGLADSTIVVLLSDHGEGLAQSPRLPQNHGDLLYNPLIHVPLSIVVPRVPGARIEQPVSLADVAPTLLDLSAVEHQPTHGVSLLPFVLGRHQKTASLLHRPLLLYEAKQRGLILWPYKLLVWWDRGLTELYDLEADFGERDNLADRRPQELQQLLTLLNGYPLIRIDRLHAQP